MATAELTTTRGAGSGFLATGGANLARRETLPSPGWFTRILLRNTPIPVLIHSLLDELQAERSLQFVEDRYMPEPFLRYLQGRGLPLGATDSFFLHDRQPLRGGLLLAGRAAGENPADLRQFAEQLRARLVHWLRMADRGPDLARLVTVEDAREFFSRRFVHYEPVGVLVWTAEHSPLERLFGARWSRTDSSLRTALRLDHPAGEAGAELAGQVPGAPNETGALVSAPVDAESALLGGNVQTAPAPALARARAADGVARAASGPTAGRQSESAADPTETVHAAGALEYQVVGRTRGPVRGGRKYHIRREGAHLRIALLAGGGARLKADHALAFFDRLQFAGDLIRAHRDLLRAMPLDGGALRPHSTDERSGAAGRPPGRHESLSLELNCESGAFRCVAYGITPLFFRRKNGRLYPLPDSSMSGDPGAGSISLKTVEGVFHPGDALLLMPGTYTASERRELAARFRELLTGDSTTRASVRMPRSLAASLGPWLDVRLRGRGLLIGRP